MSSSNIVHVSNLSYNVAECHLKEIFGTCGKIIDVQIARNQHEQSLRWALVTFEDEEMASDAIDYLHEGQIDGLTIYVRYATQNDSLP